MPQDIEVKRRKSRERMAQLRAADPEKYRSAKRQWYAEHRDKLKESMKRQYEANAEKRRAYRKEYVKTHAPNIAARRAASLRWVKNHPEKARAAISRRLSAIKQATPKWFSAFDAFVIQEAKSLATLRSKVTGIKWHVDHVIPLRGDTVCGLHVGTNIAVIPAAVDRAKGNKFPYPLTLAI